MALGLGSIEFFWVFPSSPALYPLLGFGGMGVCDAGALLPFPVGSTPGPSRHVRHRPMSIIEYAARAGTSSW